MGVLAALSVLAAIAIVRHAGASSMPPGVGPNPDKSCYVVSQIYGERSCTFVDGATDAEGLCDRGACPEGFLGSPSRLQCFKTGLEPQRMARVAPHVALQLFE